MEQGFYWIQYGGRVQVAYYTDIEIEGPDTGRVITGIWHLTQGDDICDDGEAEILAGPLTPPHV